MPVHAQKTSQRATRHARQEQHAEREAKTRGQSRWQAMADRRPALAQLRAAQVMANTATAQRQPNRTGLPDRLKAGIEALSGIAMDDVRVHYGSDRPAQLQALAYAQGTDIHIAPGQERHLPHEAWHVVQQAQGRVRPTLTLGGTAINDSPELEHEADVMGMRAME